MRRILLPLLLLLPVAACVEDTRPQGAACEAPTIEVTLSVSADAMEPGNPAVCRDQEVTLVVASSVDGVIHIHGYDRWVPATEVVAGEDLELSFVAEQPGQFPVELHPSGDPEGVELGIFTVHEP